MTDKLATEAPDSLAEWKPGENLAPAPDYIKGSDREGVEGITKRDILMPRLALAQALSPQVTEGDPRRIEGLKAGDLFNSLSGRVYGGRKPVFVQIIRKDRPRAMEFRPMDEGGGVLDPDVPLNDPRLKWPPKDSKERKPQATEFRDYLARILPEGELIALSFKSSGIQAAKTLNGRIAIRGEGQLYAGRYAIWTDIKQTPKPHQIYLVDNAGWVSPEDLEIGKRLYNAMKDFDMVTNIDHAHPQDNTDFDPEELERQSQAASNPGM